MKYVVLFPESRHTRTSRLYAHLMPDPMFYEFDMFARGDRENVLSIDSSAARLVHDPLRSKLISFWGWSARNGLTAEAMRREGFEEIWVVKAAQTRRRERRALGIVALVVLLIGVFACWVHLWN